MVRSLRVVLVLRALVCLIFAGYFASATSLPALIERFADYAMADGLLALLLAVLAVPAPLPNGIAAFGAIDGLIRVAAALAVYLGPGIPYFAVTAVLYMGILATLALLLGILVLTGAERLNKELGWNLVSALLLLEGLATVVFAVAAFLLTPYADVVRVFFIVGVLLEAIPLLTVAARLASIERGVKSHRMPNGVR
jgi:hypothetical protein